MDLLLPRTTFASYCRPGLNLAWIRPVVVVVVVIVLAATALGCGNEPEAVENAPTTPSSGVGSSTPERSRATPATTPVPITPLAGAGEQTAAVSAGSALDPTAAVTRPPAAAPEPRATATTAPSPTPSPTATRPAPPTATPDPKTRCEEWYAYVMDWVKAGNIYDTRFMLPPPDLPGFTFRDALEHCGSNRFPWGRFYGFENVPIGDEWRHLLPGLYRYVAIDGENLVQGEECQIILNRHEPEEITIPMPQGQPFEVRIKLEHRTASAWRWAGCEGWLARVGD